jgi:hypothetical protein
MEKIPSNLIKKSKIYAKKTIKNYYNTPKWFFYNKTRKNTKHKELQKQEDGVIVNNRNDIFYNDNDNFKKPMSYLQNIRFSFFNSHDDDDDVYYYDSKFENNLKYRETNKKYFKIILEDIKKYFKSVYDTLCKEEDDENVKKIIVYFSKFKEKHEYMYLGELIHSDDTIKKKLMYYLLPLIVSVKAIHFATKIIPDSYDTFEDYKKNKIFFRVVFCTLLTEDNIIRYFNYDDIILKDTTGNDNIIYYFPSAPKEYLNYKLNHDTLLEIVNDILKKDCNNYTPIIEIKKSNEQKDLYCTITPIKKKCDE